MNYLEELNKIRKRIYIKIIITISIFLGFIVFLMCNSDSGIEMLIITLPLGYFFLKTIIKMFVIKNDKHLYDKIYKENILLNCLKENFTDVKYILPNDDFPDTTLLPKDFVDVLEDIRISGGILFNDYISANYKNIKFECIDIKMISESGRHEGPSSGSTHTSFKGQWLVIETNKKIETNIQIFSKAFKGNKKNGLLSGKKYKEIKTNDIEFDNQFNVFVEKELDVSNILTPNIIKKIKEINNKLKLKIFICFIDNKICVLLENKKDLFEPNIYKNINLEVEKNKILNQIKSIIELLDLNN